ncbi:MAG: hypothetical protein ACR2HO_12485 [Rubrobacteraceae bacterium]
MSGHWGLALRHAAWMLVAAAVIGGVLVPVYGADTAGSLLYGVAMAALSFVSTALTVSLFSGKSAAAGVMIGAGSFMARFAFAAAVLGIPAYLDLWPVVPMLIGFAGTYVAENVAIMVELARGTDRQSKRKLAGRPSGGGAERRLGQ